MQKTKYKNDKLWLSEVVMWWTICIDFLEAPLVAWQPNSNSKKLHARVQNHSNEITIDFQKWNRKVVFMARTLLSANNPTTQCSKKWQWVGWQYACQRWHKMMMTHKCPKSQFIAHCGINCCVCYRGSCEWVNEGVLSDTAREFTAPVPLCNHNLTFQFGFRMD